MVLTKEQIDSGPYSEPHLAFWCGKTDDHYARNILLWFVKEKGLDDELIDYMKINVSELFKD